MSTASTPSDTPSDTLLVGTRKGLVTLRRRSSGWEVGGLRLANVSVTALLPAAGDRPLIAGTLHGHFGPKLYALPDQGGDEDRFAELGLPAHPPAADGAEPDVDPNRRELRPDATALLWSLAETGDGTLWCGTMPGGLFSSADGGATWDLDRGLWDQPTRPDWFGGGYDHPAIHSVVPDPRGPERLAIGISCAGAWRTDDGGATWVPGTGMKAPFMPPERQEEPTIQDPHRIVRSPADPDVLWCQHHSGIYRSTDDARTWTEIPEAGPSTFGFAVATHPHDADAAWFVPAEADEARIPVDAKLVVTRTRDGGESFDVLDRGLPAGPAWDLVYRHGLDVDGTGERLAMGSTTGNLWISDDGGDSWDHVSAHLPPIAVVTFA